MFHIRPLKRTAAVVGAILLAGAPLSASVADSGGQDQGFKLHDSDPPDTPIDWIEGTSSDEEGSLRPIPAEMMELSGRVAVLYEQDPRFSTLEFTLDAEKLLVWWYGPVPDDLAELLEGSSVETEIREVPILPAKLREAATAAITDPDLGVTVAGPARDGTGLNIMFDSDSRWQSQGVEELEEILGVPIVSSQPGSMMGIARQNDMHVLGGARINRFNFFNLIGQCTTGFSVEQGTQKGMLFASHCGTPGWPWVVWPDNTGPNLFLYGNNGTHASVTPNFDAAILQTDWNTEGVYVGDWTSSLAAPINGSIPHPTTVPIGTRLCFSGSFSGTVCENVVEANNQSYTISIAGGGPVTYLGGVLSRQIDDLPAAGNGDSGGAAYVLEVDTVGTTRYAASIISAIPLDSPTDCTGVPGDANRRCNPWVMTSPVNPALIEMGWTLSTYP